MVSEVVGDRVRRIKYLSRSKSGDLRFSTEEVRDSSVSFSNSTGCVWGGGKQAIRSLKPLGTSKYTNRSRVKFLALALSSHSYIHEWKGS